MSTVNGIILAGGQSSRMGKPKALLNYHGIPQYQYLKGLLDAYCKGVYVSCTQEQEALFEGISCITDAQEYANSGPLGGIITCMEQLNSSLLIVGCDYPLLTSGHIKVLMDKRDQVSFGTVFTTPVEMKTEPLISLIEYSFLEILKEEFYNGKQSVNALMQRENFSRIIPADIAFLESFDKPEQFQKFNKMSDI